MHPPASLLGAGASPANFALYAVMHILAIAIVTVSLTSVRVPGWALIVDGIALALWAAWVLFVIVLRIMRVNATPRIDAAIIAMVGLQCLTSSIAVVPSQLVTLAVVVMAVFRVIAEAHYSWRIAVAFALIVLVFTPIGAWISHGDVRFVAITYVSTLTVGAIAFGRRSRNAATAAQQALVEQTLAAQHEREEVARLEERTRLARELHDVLAHSLGALSLQLDAVLALVDAGRLDDVRTRVAGARDLAATGLVDARRAVAALRAPSSDVGTLIESLLAVHRDSGGEVTLEETGDPSNTSLDDEAVEILGRVLGELLANARKHAPGQAVDLELAWRAVGVTISATNADAPRGSQSNGLAQSGSGLGLRGMRERVEAAGGTMSVRRAEGEFSVTIEIPAAVRGGAGEKA